MTKRSHHVIPNPKGGWSVKKEGASRASKHFDKKKDAEAWGKSFSRKEGTDFVVHRHDGTVVKRDSYGNDPTPPRDHDAQH